MQHNLHRKVSPFLTLVSSYAKKFGKIHDLIKFIYSEKASNFCEIPTVDLQWRFRKNFRPSQNMWTLRKEKTLQRFYIKYKINIHGFFGTILKNYLILIQWVIFMHLWFHKKIKKHSYCTAINKCQYELSGILRKHVQNKQFISYFTINFVSNDKTMHFFVFLIFIDVCTRKVNKCLILGHFKGNIF